MKKKDKLSWTSGVVPHRIIEKIDNSRFRIDGISFIRENHFRVIPMNNNEECQYVKIPLTHSKTAWVIIPKDINEADVKIIEHGLANILLRIKLEKEPSTTP